MEFYFETCGVGALYSPVETVLDLYSSGRTTGCVLNCGFETSRASVVYEGVLQSKGSRIAHVGGRDVTDMMIKCLREKGYTFGGLGEERNVANDIKEKLTRVALDYEDEMRTAKERARTYTLPDGSTVEVDEACIKCPEVLFSPALIGRKRALSVQEMVSTSIFECDIDIRKDLYMNIICTGGSSMFLGFADRLREEVVKRETTSLRRHVKIIAPPDRLHSAWIGGSIMSCLSPFWDSWITKDTYDELGPQRMMRLARYSLM